jgi:uncharacterized membrane protein
LLAGALVDSKQNYSRQDSPTTFQGAAMYGYGPFELLLGILVVVAILFLIVRTMRRSFRQMVREAMEEAPRPADGRTVGVWRLASLAATL